MSLEEQRIKGLYKLLEELEQHKKDDEAALLRWAIFELERKYNIVIK